MTGGGARPAADPARLLNGRAGGPALAAVVLAAGSGVRVGAAHNKIYLPLGPYRVVSWSLDTLRRLPRLRRLILVVRSEDRRMAEDILASELDGGGTAIQLVDGGATRHASEERALAYLAPDIRAGIVDVVLIHDAARPFCSLQLATAVVQAAAVHGGAIPGLPAKDVVEVADNDVAGYLDTRHVRVQTPQGFAARPLLAAYEAAVAAEFTGTDTSSCIERFGSIAVRYIAGEPTNIKITYPEDLLLAEQLLGRLPGRRRSDT
jgi:2-C-methyl-D-erythritol 4-phosphate cytidylyltransferase